MKLPQLARFLLLAVALKAAPAVAAEPAPSGIDNKQAQGKVRYERGVDAYAAGRFKDAIDLFLQADALAPSAALSFNIARAYEKIGDDAAALQWYRDFARRSPDAKNADKVAERVRELEAALAAKGVQQLTIMSLPPGATVAIDGQPVGVTPYTGQLPPGAHQVVLSLKGYAEASREVALAPEHAQDVTFELAATPAASAPPVVTPSGPASSAPPPDRPVRQEKQGPRFGPWPYVGIGIGAAVLAGGLGFEVARRKAEDAGEAEETQVGYKEKLDSMQSRQLTARVLTAVGGALVLTGGALLVIDLTSRKSKDEKPLQASALCLPGGCAVSVGGAL